jgi:hypothetical protein
VPDDTKRGWKCGKKMFFLETTAFLRCLPNTREMYEYMHSSDQESISPMYMSPAGSTARHVLDCSSTIKYAESKALDSIPCLK